VSDSTLLSAEKTLAELYETVSAVMSFRVFVVAITVAFVIAVIFPSTLAITRFAEARGLFGRAGLVLTAMTSFTFFAHEGLAEPHADILGELEWKAESKAREADEAADELVANVYLQQKVENLTPSETVLVRSILHHAASHTYRTKIIALIARNAAASATQADKEIAAEARSATVTKPPQTIQAAEELIEFERLRTERLAESKRAAQEVLAETLSKALPDISEEIINVFRSEMIGALAQTLFEAGLSRTLATTEVAGPVDRKDVAGR
jgi:hypothetical protein